jgi:hypothetical protein
MRVGLFGAVTLAASSLASYSCPDYNLIRQPSVDSSVFDIDAFAGVWYMIATNEVSGVVYTFQLLIDIIFITLSIVFASARLLNSADLAGVLHMRREHGRSSQGCWLVGIC